MNRKLVLLILLMLPLNKYSSSLIFGLVIPELRYALLFIVLYKCDIFK